MTKVLVIDDEPQIVRALKASLEASDYGVVSAGTGEGGLALAAAQEPDIVVLDLGLPDLHGAEVIRRLRTWTHMPVIVLSVREGQDDKIAALDMGADDYVIKLFRRGGAPGEDEGDAAAPRTTRRRPHIADRGPGISRGGSCAK